MKVYIEKENRRMSLKFKGIAASLLKKLNINKESVLVVRNNKLIELDEKLSDKDNIKILSVVSGG